MARKSFGRSDKGGRGDKGGRNGGRRNKSRYNEQSKCRFCREKTREIDYKDTSTLQKLITQHGKIFSRKRSGNCARHQRSAKRAIKRARFMGLIPYIT